MWLSARQPLTAAARAHATRPPPTTHCSRARIFSSRVTVPGSSALLVMARIRRSRGRVESTAAGFKDRSLHLIFRIRLMWPSSCLRKRLRNRSAASFLRPPTSGKHRLPATLSTSSIGSASANCARYLWCCPASNATARVSMRRRGHSTRGNRRSATPRTRGPSFRQAPPR